MQNMQEIDSFRIGLVSGTDAGLGTCIGLFGLYILHSIMLDETGENTLAIYL